MKKVKMTNRLILVTFELKILCRQLELRKISGEMK